MKQSQKPRRWLVQTLVTDRFEGLLEVPVPGSWGSGQTLMTARLEGEIHHVGQIDLKLALDPPASDPKC